MVNEGINSKIMSLYDEIVNAIKEIRYTKKRPDESSIYNYIAKKYKEHNLDKYDVTNAIVTLLVTNKISNKKSNNKCSFFINTPIPTTGNETPTPTTGNETPTTRIEIDITPHLIDTLMTPA